MGDTAEFEKLTELEARLARALDRISGGLSAGNARGGGSDDPAVLAEADAARLEAESQVSELTERVAALETRLAEAQDSLEEAQTELIAARAVPPRDDEEMTDLKGELARAQAAQAEAEAARHTAEAALAEAEAVGATKDAALEAMRKTASEAETPASTDTGRDAPEPSTGVLERRVARLRAERDDAQDMLDEMREDGAAEPDTRILGLRRDVRILQGQVDNLTAELRNHSDGALDADAALRAELEALRALRAAEAQELTRIISEISAEAEVKHA